MLSTPDSDCSISRNADKANHAGMDVRTIRRANLAALVRAHGGNKPLADAIGTDAAYISQLLSNKTKADMGHMLARRIEKALDLEPGWMDQPHTAGPPSRVAEEPPQYLSGARMRLHPLISWVQAGDWSDAFEHLTANDAEEWYPCAVRCGPRTFVLRVQGQSMEPRFTDGELIFVDPDAEARHGSFVVVRLDDTQQATFKQLIIENGRRFLRPLNDRWPEPIIQINGNATLCGVVIFQGRPV